MKTLTKRQEQWLHAALDGELDNEQWEEVARLLDENPAFAAEWEAQESILLQLEGLEGDTDVELWTEIEAQLPQKAAFWERKETYWLSGLLLMFLTARGLDNYVLNLGDLTFRFVALGIAVFVFAALKINPFRLAEDHELQGL
jgi:ferric-dicitrate binding protein FerR (iron transport regulator)